MKIWDNDAAVIKDLARLQMALVTAKSSYVEGRPWRILGLTGGGIRGIFQAVYLREVAKEWQQSLLENFDLIAGTSTGALIALGIALDVDLSKVIRIFKTHGPQIFGRKKPLHVIRRGPQYSAELLRKVLQDVYGDKQLKHCNVPTLVFSTILNQYRHRVFSNLKDADKEYSAVDVAMASCAAPTYFPSFCYPDVCPDVEEERTYVDGGLWANNPSLIAVISSHTRLGVQFKDVRLVSLGNGSFPSGIEPEEYNSARPLALVDEILEIMFSSQDSASVDYAGQLVGEHNVFRVDAKLRAPIHLDDVDGALGKLPPIAQSEARDQYVKLRTFLQGNTSAQPSGR